MIYWTNKPKQFWNNKGTESYLGFEIPIEINQVNFRGGKNQCLKEIARIKNINRGNGYAIGLYDNNGKIIRKSHDQIQWYLLYDCE